MIMAFTIPFQTLVHLIREQYLIPAKRDKAYIMSADVGAVINLCLNLLFIPWVSAFGAAVATLVAEVSVLIMQMIMVHKMVPIHHYLKGKWFYLLPGILMFGIVRMIGDFMGVHVFTLVVQVVTGTVIYMVFSLTYWVITKNENCLAIIKKLLSGFGRRFT